MTAHSDTASRRRFLKLAGGSVALIPLLNLYGCEGEDRPAGALEETRPGTEPVPGTRTTTPDADGAAETESAPSAQGEQSAGGQTAQAEGAADQGGALEKLDEASAQAQALGYKHSAEEVDQSAFPSYQEGQVCGNCSLFQPELGNEPWGGCQIFPGKLVNTNGWCSAYVPAG